MFSNSTNNIINNNPFAHLPSSSNYHLLPPSLVPPPHPLPPHLIHDSSDMILTHHHDLVPAGSLLSPNPQLTESLINMALLNNATTIKHDGGVGVLHGDYFGAPAVFNIPAARKPIKKDRHSKICTAQGVRDRRVRLSIEIAREFFDLQDMLGFDKASKTLEWLLTKSKYAIKELYRMKHDNNGGQRINLSTSTDLDPYCNMVAENDGAEMEHSALKSKSQELGVICKEKKMKKVQKATVPMLAKESRAKARARARERTREKMCTRSSTTSISTIQKCKNILSSSDTSCPQLLNPLKSLTQLEASKKSDYFYDQNQKMASSSTFKVVAHQDQVQEAAAGCCSTAVPRLIEESIVIKRKLKPSTILGYQQNVASASKDPSCSIDGGTGNSNYFPNLSPAWDINGAMAHSTFSAIANFNLSTGVHIYGKP